MKTWFRQWETCITVCSEFEEQCQNNNLVIFHQNIRSFNKNYDFLSSFVEGIKTTIDIIVLSETWFSEDLKCDIDGYNSFHSYRTSKVGGGVSIYVRSGIGVYTISDKCIISDDVESCVVEIICGDNDTSREKLTLFGIYRPPSASLINFSEILNGMIADSVNKNVVLVGDFNIDLVEEESSTDFSNMMYSHNMYPLINVPTRVTDSSATCIDHIWYNGYNVSHSGCFVTDISDHYLIFCVLNILSNKLPY